MMFIDNKGKLFGKISIVDICVVLVIVVGVLGAYVTFSKVNSGKFSDNSKLALNSASPVICGTVTFEAKGVRAMTRDSLREGDTVFETEDNLLVGTISNVSSQPAKNTYIADDGTFFTAEIPEKYDVKITVDISGKNTQTGFHTESGLQLLYGKEIEIKTSSVKTKPKIIALNLESVGE